jgi:hypothetical protein
VKAAFGLAILTAAAAAAASPPVPVKTSVRNETTPAAGGEYFAWAKSRRGRPNVYDVWAQHGTAPPFKVNAPKTRGWAGGIDGTRLVYQQVKGGSRSDIRLFDLATRRRSAPRAGVNTSRWEWAPSLSGDWLLFGRGAATSGSLQQVILQNLVSGERLVLDRMVSRHGYLEAGQVNGNYAVWTRCNSGRNPCDVFRFDIAARTKTAMPRAGHSHFGASVTPSGTAYYGRRNSRRYCDSPELVKTTLAGVTEILYTFPPGQDFIVSHAVAIPVRPPELEATRVYFDLTNCTLRHFDVYRIDDVVRGPPP